MEDLNNSKSPISLLVLIGIWAYFINFMVKGGTSFIGMGNNYLGFLGFLLVLILLIGYTIYVFKQLKK